jgi:RNA polymerase sigma-70 factor (ECF subfamily)
MSDDRAMDKKWSEVYDENVELVRGILYRMGVEHELEDLLQECFIKVWKGLKNFRGESKLKTWITRIAMNTVYDHFRRKGVSIKTTELDDAKLAAVAAEPASENEPQSLLKSLQILSVAHREVLVLHIIEENSIEEVAEILGVAAGIVKSRLFHARENLKKILGRVD